MLVCASLITMGILLLLSVTEWHASWTDNVTGFLRKAITFVNLKK